jgi:hypothetical protein
MCINTDIYKFPEFGEIRDVISINFPLIRPAHRPQIQYITPIKDVLSSVQFSP